MKPLAKPVLTAAAIAAIAFLLAGSNRGAAGAQQKPPATPLLVRSIDEPGLNPFQESQNILFTNFSGTAFFTTPPGRLAVIEEVSISGAVSSGGEVQAFFRCFDSVTSQEVNHSLVLFPQGDVNGFTQYSGNQACKCYASAGGLSVHVQSSNFNSSQHTWVMAVSGYLVTR